MTWWLNMPPTLPAGDKRDGRRIDAVGFRQARLTDAALKLLPDCFHLPLVQLRFWMSRAFAKVAVPPAALAPVPVVICFGAHVEMVRVHACRHIAFVQNALALRYGAVRQLPGNTMRARALAFVFDLAVPKRMPIGGPDVAPSRGTGLPLFVKSLADRNLVCRHESSIA